MCVGSTRELRFPALLPTSAITIVGFLCADMLAIARLLGSYPIKEKKKLLHYELQLASSSVICTFNCSSGNCLL